MLKELFDTLSKLHDVLFKPENGPTVILAIIIAGAIMACGLAAGADRDPGTCVATVDSNKLPLGGMLGGQVTFVDCPDATVSGPMLGATWDYVDLITHPFSGRYDNDPCEIELGWPFGSITC